MSGLTFVDSIDFQTERDSQAVININKTHPFQKSRELMVMRVGGFGTKHIYNININTATAKLYHPSN